MIEQSQIIVLREDFNPHTATKEVLKRATDEIDEAKKVLKERRREITALLEGDLRLKTLQRKQMELEKLGKELEREKGNLEAITREIARTASSLSKAEDDVKLMRAAWIKALRDYNVPIDLETKEIPRIDKITTLAEAADHVHDEAKVLEVITRFGEKAMGIVFDTQISPGEQLSLFTSGEKVSRLIALYTGLAKAERQLETLKKEMKVMSTTKEEGEQRTMALAIQCEEQREALASSTAERERLEEEGKEIRQLFSRLNDSRNKIAQLLQQRLSQSSARVPVTPVMEEPEKLEKKNHEPKEPENHLSEEEQLELRTVEEEYQIIVRRYHKKVGLKFSTLMNLARACSTAEVLEAILILNPTRLECRLLLSQGFIGNPHVVALGGARKESTQLKLTSPPLNGESDIGNSTPLKDVKILYVGGKGRVKTRTLDALRRAGAIMGVPHESMRHKPVDGFDLVVVNTGCCSHDLYYHYRKLCNGSGKFIEQPAAIRQSRIVANICSIIEQRRKDKELQREEE